MLSQQNVLETSAAMLVNKQIWRDHTGIRLHDDVSL